MSKFNKPYYDRYLHCCFVVTSSGCSIYYSCKGGSGEKWCKEREGCKAQEYNSGDCFSCPVGNKKSTVSLVYLFHMDLLELLYKQHKTYWGCYINNIS